MNRLELQCLSQLIEAFTKLQHPDSALKEIVCSLTRLVQARVGHIVDVKRTLETSTLHDISFGTDIDTKDFAVTNARLFSQNPVLPILPKVSITAFAQVDVVGSFEWKKSEYYNEFMRPFDLNDAFIVFPRRRQRTARYGLGFGHSAGNGFGKTGLRRAQEIETILWHGFECLEKWRAIASDVSLLRLGVEHSTGPLLVIRGRRIVACSRPAEELLGINSVAGSRNIVIQDIVDAVVSARQHGALSATISRGPGRELHLEMRDVLDAVYGRGTIVHVSVPSERSKSGDIYASAVELGLTSTQAAVLTALANGLCVPKIGRMMGARPNTVRVHIQRIYSRLNVSNRIEAVNCLRVER